MKTIPASKKQMAKLQRRIDAFPANGKAANGQAMHKPGSQNRKK